MQAQTVRTSSGGRITQPANRRKGVGKVVVVEFGSLKEGEQPAGKQGRPCPRHVLAQTTVPQAVVETSGDINVKTRKPQKGHKRRSAVK